MGYLRSENAALKAELEKVLRDKGVNDTDYLRLSAENNALRSEREGLVAALEKLRDGPGNNMVGWKLTWAHEFASKALARWCA